MKFHNNVNTLINKVLEDIKECNSSVLKEIQNAPSELSKTYYILQFVSPGEYTHEEFQLAVTTGKQIEDANEFTLEDVKFLRSKNGNNPKLLYWDKLIEELENK